MNHWNACMDWYSSCTLAHFCALPLLQVAIGTGCSIWCVDINIAVPLCVNNSMDCNSLSPSLYHCVNNLTGCNSNDIFCTYIVTVFNLTVDSLWSLLICCRCDHVTMFWLAHEVQNLIFTGLPFSYVLWTLANGNIYIVLLFHCSDDFKFGRFGSWY